MWKSYNYLIMKKTYTNPKMRVLQLQGEKVLAASGVTSNNGISYGGIDEDGTKDPSVKANPFGDSIFEEE